MNDRIPTPRAMKNVTALLLKLFPEVAKIPGEEKWAAPEIEFVGSIRRGSDDVHDVDLLAPLPVTGEPDVLYERLAKLYGDAKADAKAMLFAPEPENKLAGGVWGRVEKGLSPEFKLCSIIMPLPGKAGSPDGPGWEYPFDLKVEFHRYTPGPKGNKGWIQMITTGPGKKNDNEMGWGEMMLYRWKQRNEGGRSHEGWPVYADGTRRPVPTELEAFLACGFTGVIPPHMRTCVYAKQLASAVRKTA